MDNADFDRRGRKIMSGALTMQESIARLRLIRCAGIGPVTFRRLLNEYPHAVAALNALPERLRRAGHRALTIPSEEEVESEWIRTTKLGARILFFDDPAYPLFMKLVPDAPAAITVLGHVERLSQSSVAIVGARNASAAGLRMAETLATGLAEAGVVVVSGLALGIDRAAHIAALFPGYTVAALAGGIDTLYPPENKTLRDDIAARGCLVTEAPLGTIPQGRHFPRRNRLIAGMSQGVVVVEGGLRSGTLITAKMALDYGRDIFAVPGSPLDPRSRGGNELIRQGAILTETVEDILRNLSDTVDMTPAPPQRTRQAFDMTQLSLLDTQAQLSDDPRRRITSLLSSTPISVDDLVDKSQCSVSVVSSVLSALELDGEATFLPDGQIVVQQPEV